MALVEYLMVVSFLKSGSRSVFSLAERENEIGMQVIEINEII